MVFSLYLLLEKSSIIDVWHDAGYFSDFLISGLPRIFDKYRESHEFFRLKSSMPEKNEFESLNFVHINGNFLDIVTESFNTQSIL